MPSLPPSSSIVKQLRTIDTVVYNTFQEAAQAAGLFEQSNEGELAMEDAISQYRSPAQLRHKQAQPSELSHDLRPTRCLPDDTFITLLK